MTTAQLVSTGITVQNVLFATDLSDYCNHAMDFALEVAHAYQAMPHVVHVFAIQEFVIGGPEAVSAAREATVRDLAMLRTDLRRHHGYIEGRDYSLSLMEGNVAESILEAAERKQIDLIICATHGHSGLGRVLMGSVAEQVFRQSPVPVMTIGPHLHLASAARAPESILLAADFSPASAQAAIYARSVALQHGANLTVLHVLEPAARAGGVDRSTVEFGVERKLRALLGNEAIPGCNVRMETGKVVPTILRTAGEVHADLLILGVRSWNGVFDRFMWPHAYEVVREARCPVLTVRAKGIKNKG